MSSELLSTGDGERVRCVQEKERNLLKGRERRFSYVRASIVQGAEARPGKKIADRNSEVAVLIALGSGVTPLQHSPRQRRFRSDRAHLRCSKASRRGLCPELLVWISLLALACWIDALLPHRPLTPPQSSSSTEWHACPRIHSTVRALLLRGTHQQSVLGCHAGDMSVKWPREKDLQELLHKAGKRVTKGVLDEAAEMVLEDSKEVRVGSGGNHPPCCLLQPQPLPLRGRPMAF